MSEHKFPTEVIDLPSEGKVYPKDSPLSSGKLELKYMTTREEDILMSENLIKKGVVIDKLLDSLIITKGVKQEDLILGDKNAVLVASRILAYGPEYTVEVLNPNDVSTDVNLYNCLLTVSGSTFLLRSTTTLTPSRFDSSLISLMPSIFFSLASSAILSFKTDLFT